MSAREQRPGRHEEPCTTETLSAMLEAGESSCIFRAWASARARGAHSALLPGSSCWCAQQRTDGFRRIEFL